MFRYAYISFKRKMKNETGFNKGRKSPSVFLLLNEKGKKKGKKKKAHKDKSNHVGKA